MEPAPASAAVNEAIVAGPMSRPISPSGTASAGTTSVGTSASIACAAMTSSGRYTGTSRSRAAANARWMSSIRSSSTSEAPTLPPAAAINVNAIAPPITRASTRSVSEAITPSLSLTFAPPRTATNGRAGASSRRPSTATSPSTSLPATAARPLAIISSGSPTTDACARCTAPKASST